MQNEGRATKQVAYNFQTCQDLRNRERLRNSSRWKETKETRQLNM